MLINLSNHPSAKWTEKQRQAADEQFGAIEDIPFPKVDPSAKLEDVNHLSHQYVKTILKMRPDAVHIMGEFTFTYSLVNKLKAQKIPCLASTTERIVEELKDGTRKQTFRFVQFRPYFLQSQTRQVSQTRR